MNYYNEIDPYCCEWLQNLIDAGEIPPGEIDSRSIADVRPEDLDGYTQCHFFCGISGWSLALRIAGWPESRSVWTASPPCQDNSVAVCCHKKRTGTTGSRSGLVFPWLDLVDAVRPGSIFFENVPGIQPWLGEIQSRLEASGYTVSVAIRAASDIGAPHQRRRLWLHANRDGKRLPQSWEKRPSSLERDPWATTPRGLWRSDYADNGVLGNGISNRVATIRALGNAIVPQVAAEFIRAFMEV